MLDTQTIKAQLDAAHGALKAASAIIETLYGALDVAERELERSTTSVELSPDDVEFDLECNHNDYVNIAVMGDPTRKLCKDCGETFNG